jgi:hypothetical protein
MIEMIQQTCAEIGQIQERSLAAREAREARRKKLRYMDALIEQFELLNLQQATLIPGELTLRVMQLAQAHGHPIVAKPAGELEVIDWMDALYELEGELMFGDEEDDAR